MKEEGDERSGEQGDTVRAAQVSLSDTWSNKGLLMAHAEFTCFTGKKILDLLALLAPV